MLPMEHTLIILKSQFVIHYKIYLIIYVMECPKLCSTILIPEWNTFKIKPSKVDSLKICDNVGFNILTLFLIPDIISKKKLVCKHIFMDCLHILFQAVFVTLLGVKNSLCYPGMSKWNSVYTFVLFQNNCT